MSDASTEPHDEDAPGPEVTNELFVKWRYARRGVSGNGNVGQDFTNPYWLWLFRRQIDPYGAQQYFSGKSPGPPGPDWAGNRMGMSKTQLSDGRTIWVAGEHEDFYDPDFFIYNDVIIRDAKHSIKIFAYGQDAFPPTDFHSATPYENESKLLLIGALDYPSNRKVGFTRVQSLDLSSLAITQIATTGEAPGWIHKHKAVLEPDGSGVTVTGGIVYDGNNYMESINEWRLSFSDWKWTKLTDRKWTRIEVQRKDQQSLHLFNYSMLDFELKHRGLKNLADSDLAKELNITPDLDLYAKFYVPSISHQPVLPIQEDQEEEEDEDEDDFEEDEDDLLPDSLMSEENDDWRTRRILIGETCVRFLENPSQVTITIEGELPKEQVQAIAQEMCDRLTVLENAQCELVWHTNVV